MGRLMVGRPFAGSNPAPIRIAAGPPQVAGEGAGSRTTRRRISGRGHGPGGAQ